MNPNYFLIAMPVLFLPFKLKANTTLCVITFQLNRLFLPFKLKANTTLVKGRTAKISCFCLSN